MICQDARELFPALVDGHIGLTERIPLEAHLSECGNCQNALEVLGTSEHPRPPAWWPRPESGFVNRAKEVTRTLAIIRPLARLDRLRKRMRARVRLSRRPAAAVFADSPELIRRREKLAEPSGRVGRINRRPRLGLDRIRAFLEAMVQDIDIRPWLRRASNTMRHLVPRPRLDFAVTRKALDSIRRPRTLHRPRRPVSPHARPTTRRGGLGLDAIRKVLPSIRPAHVLARTRAWVWSPSRFVRPARAGLCALKTWIETTGSVTRAAWLRLQIVRQLKVKHLRLPVTLGAATLGAVGVFSYRAELDGAFRRWVPSAPSVAEAPPPTRPPVVASTERTPRPELPSVPPSPPATPPRQEPVTARPVPVPSAQARQSRSDRAVKSAEGRSAEAERAPPPPGTTRASLDVVGKLVVKNRGGAERDLTALVARAGGTTVSRQRGPHVTVIEAVVPNPSYGRFAAGLNRIGSWQIEAGRSILPDPVRVTVRLAE